MSGEEEKRSGKIKFLFALFYKIGFAPLHFKSSQSLVKWAFASLFFALWYYFGTKVNYY